MLTVGDKLPAFDLKAVVSLEKGKEFEITTDSYPGKWLVVFFWPMDFTFVCPTEIAEFGRRNADFADRDAQVLGVSTDTHYVHLAWRKDHPDLQGPAASRCSPTPSASSRRARRAAQAGRRAAARDVHRRSRGHHPLGQRQRPVGRPQRGRGAARARRAADRRALPVQLEEGRSRPWRRREPMPRSTRSADALPEAAKDIKLNLQAVLREGRSRRRSAGASRSPRRSPRATRALRDARAWPTRAARWPRGDRRRARGRGADGDEQRVLPVPPHGREAELPEKPARLRMNRLAQPATNKADFELFCLAVSAINGCETCVQAHEKVVLDGGLSEDHVHDAVRIAATVHAAAVALEAADTVAPASAAAE